MSRSLDEMSMRVVSSPVGGMWLVRSREPSGARSLRSAFGFLDRPDGGHTDESGMGSGNPPAESTGNTRSGVFI